MRSTQRRCRSRAPPRGGRAGSVVAVSGKAASTSATTPAGGKVPSRTRCCAAVTGRFTCWRTNRRAVATTAGTASTASVRGTCRRTSITRTLVSWSNGSAFLWRAAQACPRWVTSVLSMPPGQRERQLGFTVGVLRSAEADGNRTRLVELLDHVGVEDRGGHQAPIRLRPKILGARPVCPRTRDGPTARLGGRAVPVERTQLTPSFSAAILVPSTRFLIFWNATSRA
jgi:hypothetical protein